MLKALFRFGAGLGGSTGIGLGGTGGFGAASGFGGQDGTAVVPYTPAADKDTTGVTPVPITIHSISAMQQYKSKCHEVAFQYSRVE